jgi:tRNA-2-methylthio-N6-dimethylallyladenosine synthase
MNHHDSEHLEGQLLEHGLERAQDSEQADLVLLNTCSVREKPVQKIISRIGSLAQRSPAPSIGVCGCVAQQEGAELMSRSPTVAFVLGPGQIGRVGEALRAVEQGQRPVLTGFDAELEYNYHSIFRKSSTRGMVTVVEGCNQFCTFCVVPYTRGRELSRPLGSVLDEVRHLSEEGLREVELLGQTINAYECPRGEGDFADLLDAVAQVPGLERVRYITSHPSYFSERLVAVLARHNNVSRYLHLPIQTGANRVLKRMHRRYTREQYLELVSKIRKAVPDINLSTDVIVGFPGESETDFRQTLDLLESVRFGQVFAFAFSPRPNTPASRYEDQLPDELKKERLHRLFELSDRISLEQHQAIVGREIPVLIDGDSRRTADDWQGRGEDNRVVNFPKTGYESLGDLVSVRIVRAGNHSLYGELAERSRELPVLPLRPAS